MSAGVNKTRKDEAVKQEARCVEERLAGIGFPFFSPFCPSGFRPRQKRDPLVRKPAVNAAWNSRGPRRQRRSHGEKTNIGSPPEFTVTHREPIWVRFGFLRVRILRSACAGPQRRMCGRDASLRVCVYSEQACCNVRSRS